MSLSRIHQWFSTGIHVPALFAVLLFAVGCGTGTTGSGGSGPGSSGAMSVSIAASPTSVAAAGSSTLTVAAANATSVSVAGSDGTSFSLAATGGIFFFYTSSTTTYTASATGSSGTMTATTTVTVVAAAPPTVSISAAPGAITAGASSVLTVAATNALGVTVTGSDGSTYTLPVTGGTQTVTPSATTTYTATANGVAGSATATTTVTVSANPAPSVTISASPAAITSASSSLLTITADYATGVIVTGSDGTSYTLPATGGVQAVSPTATTTYTATAAGPGGSATAHTTVTVSSNPAPTITFTASPASIVTGSSSTLTVTSHNATAASVSGTDGSSYTLPASSGTLTVSPTATTTYTATATGAGGQASAMATVTVTAVPVPTATISASPSSIVAGNSSTLTVSATNATSVTIAGTDNSTYTLPNGGGTQPVTPNSTTTYTVTATGAGGQATAHTTVAVNSVGNIQNLDHVVMMLQENHTFDNYFGMLNPYRQSNNMTTGDDGSTYVVDGIDDKLSNSNTDDEGASFPLFKLTSTCVDDMTSSWLESYGQVSRYNFTPQRPINMDGFVHTSEDYAKNCNAGNAICAGSFHDFTGRRAMGYYDQHFLNYYYFMASEFALSDRWFSPISSKTIDNRIATFTGGTTQGLVFDPGNDDHLGTQLQIDTIFKELSEANVSWKIYYTVTQGSCLDYDDCPTTANARYPATNFSSLSDSYQYLNIPATPGQCAAPAQPSSVVGDSTNSFCIDPTHIAPLSQYYSDVSNGTLPSFAFIEPGYGVNDEHPGSGQSVLAGQAEVASIVNALMTSPSWHDSVFFLAYDEAGGPYEHVPPVPGYSNQNTDPVLGSTNAADIPDISSIAVNVDNFYPCLPPTIGTATTHCDLNNTDDPGANPNDAPAIQGFAAQLGFRVPNMVISPFTRRHYVGHTPMDHTAILKFVETRFIPGTPHMTARDNAQPDLLDFFDFNNVPWATPPTAPTPVSDPNGTTCTPANFAH